LIWGVIPRKTVVLAIKEGKGGRDNVVQVRVSKNGLSKALGMYRAGQYVFVNFPSLSLLEWHLFSVSSGPEERTFEFLIKGLGDHTGKLISAASRKENMWVRIDGPYGNMRLNYRRYPVLLLVGGGIGFTPMLGILKDMFRAGDIDKTGKIRNNVVEAVYCVWTVQTVDQYYWFGSEMNECYENNGKPGFPQLNVSIYVTKGEDNLDPVFVQGRPNFPAIFDEVSQNFPDKPVTVFVCGPKQMIQTVWDVSNQKTRSGTPFYFHKETFEF